jgi:ribose/xylose/arabinose/galactoside ABC-type transport system permease subunit
MFERTEVLDIRSILPYRAAMTCVLCSIILSQLTPAFASSRNIGNLLAQSAPVTGALAVPAGSAGCPYRRSSWEPWRWVCSC